MKRFTFICKQAAAFVFCLFTANYGQEMEKPTILYFNDGDELIDNPLYQPKAGCVFYYRDFNIKLAGDFSWAAGTLKHQSCPNPYTNPKDGPDVARNQYPGFQWQPGLEFGEGGLVFQMWFRFSLKKYSNGLPFGHVSGHNGTDRQKPTRYTLYNTWTDVDHGSANIITTHVKADGGVNFGHDVKGSQNFHEYRKMTINEWRLITIAYMKGGKLFQYVDGVLAVDAMSPKNIQPNDRLYYLKTGWYGTWPETKMTTLSDRLSVYRIFDKSQAQELAIEEYTRFFPNGPIPKPAPPTGVEVR